MKEFNVTGLCIPEKHYMCDVSAKFARCKTLIEKGKYFAINFPRQYSVCCNIRVFHGRTFSRQVTTYCV